MRIRERVLPPGWYPGNAAEVRRTIEGYIAAESAPECRAVAGVAPHAGWAFSGRIALRVLLNFRRPVETVAVVGGHLSPSAGVLAAFEEGYETPLGVLEADLELLEKISGSVSSPLREDRSPDNTVEVQLPLVKYLFPESRALALRAAPSEAAEELGRAIRKAADSLGRTVAVLGSTDLTHYGPNYGFSPAGRGERAVEWVKEVNDRGFIDKLLDLDGPGALRHAGEHQSACSAGAAVAAISFARASGVERGALVEYLTSYDIYPDDSFVGYAGIVYEKGASH
jgi:MEMO1 family protein